MISQCKQRIKTPNGLVTLLLLVYLFLLYIELTISFLIGRKRTVIFRNQHL